jgi:transposase-like protein
VDIRELQDRFPTDEAVIDFLIQSLYGNDVPCRHCGSVSVARLDTKKFKCRDCGRKFSVLKNTIFENTKQPLFNWLYAMLKMGVHGRKGISSCELARDLGVQQKTAWKMLNKIRLAMKTANEQMEKLALICEVDEVYIGGKPRKNNCKWINKTEPEKTPVVVMCERPAENRPGRARAFTMTEKDHKGRRLTQPKMTNMIEETIDVMRSEVHSDQSPLYAELASRGILHESVPHYKHYVDPAGHVHINTAESFNALPKRSHYGIYHQYKHVGRYMEEAAFRWSHRREHHDKAMTRVLHLATVNGKKNKRPARKQKKDNYPPPMGDDGQMRFDF